MATKTTNKDLELKKLKEEICKESHFYGEKLQKAKTYKEAQKLLNTFCNSLEKKKDKMVKLLFKKKK